MATSIWRDSKSFGTGLHLNTKPEADFRWYNKEQESRSNFYLISKQSVMRFLLFGGLLNTNVNGVDSILSVRTCESVGIDNKQIHNYSQFDAY